MLPSLIPSTASLTPSARHIQIVADPRAISALVDHLIHRSGLSQREIALRLGITYQAIQSRRKAKKPSLEWIAKLAETIGARVVIELPQRGSLQSSPDMWEEK